MAPSFSKLLGLLFVVSAFHSQAQQNDYHMEYLTIDHGLPQNEVTSIIQDRKGFMWFGTRGGLARYDGYHIRSFQYEPGNTNRLSNNSIETLYEDSKGRIWIGTKSGGLNCFDPTSEKFEVYQSDPNDSTTISENRVISIAEDLEGRIWAGTWSNGLNCLDEQSGRFRRYLSGEGVDAIKCSADGTLWISAGGVLLKKERRSPRPKVVPFSKPCPTDRLTALILDEDNSRLFLAGWQNGVIVYDYKNERIARQYLNEPDSEVAGSNNIYSIFQDRDKQLWLGYWGEGLQLFNSERPFQRIFIAPHIEGKYNTDYDIVLSIFQDRSGVLWIGTDGGGICKIQKRSNLFKSFTYENSGLSSGHVLCMLEDSDGRLWIGTKGGGLNELSGDQIVHHEEIFNSIRDRKVNDVHTIYEDFNGTIWFGTNYGLHKITRVDDRTVEFLTYTHKASESNSLSDEKVTAILRDSKGRFWVGTQQQGLNRLIKFDEHGRPSFKTYRADVSNPFSLAENRISVLMEDSKGRLWVGTYKGLHLYKDDLDGFVKIVHEPGNSASISNDIITCIQEDKAGNVWVGTAGGLNKITYENDVLSATYLTKGDGLPNDYIHSILVGENNNLWVSSNGGIFKFNTADKQIHVFNANDGLQSNAFSENAGCQTRSGLMYFGGINGFNVFNPKTEITVHGSPLSFISLKIMNNQLDPGEKIDDRKILAKSISFTDEITLTHLDKVVSLEVSSLDFTFADKNQYAFKLEGFDEEWLSSGNTRTVTYTNLKPGSYTLYAKASDAGNVWAGDPIRLKIHVLPPPWKTWWAYLAYATALLLLGLLIRRFLIKQIELTALLQNAQVIKEKAELEQQKEKQMNEMKFRLFTNVSHELRTPLTLILSPLEELLARKDFQGVMRQKLLLMHRNAARLLNLVNQLLDLRKSETGNMTLVMTQNDIVKFILEVFQSFTHLAEKRNISYTFKSDIEVFLLGFDQNKIEMAVTNILSNAFKYTEDGGRITCGISLEKDPGLNKSFCHISVEDSGKGLPQQELNKIFDLYYQVAAADSVKISGTGIGLSLVKEIVHLHGGDVTVESAVGRGSKFTMKLPVEQVVRNGSTMNSIILPPETVFDRHDQQHDPACTDKPILLIIEDTDELRKYICELLYDEFNVLEASSGEEGLKVALERLPDIIVSDVMMENLDGLQLCRKVKTNERTSHIPVILLTAKTMAESEISGLNAGADDYIRKPFNPTILIARVRRLLDSRKQLKEYYSRRITLQPTNIEITPYDEKFLQKAMTYIEANLLNPDLTTESLGLELCMSHSTLFRKVKALTGLSISEFIRSIRLKRAAQLLESSTMSVAEAAFQTGFSELKYFRMYFKKQFGCLPSEYGKRREVHASED